MSRIVVAGDVHLGSDNADVAAFDAFLSDLYRDRSAIAEVVFLGDLWDMVRRDPFGVAWETAETVQQVKRLAQSLPVTIVTGNHDALLGHLDDDRYAIDVREAYSLEQGDSVIQFRHGNEFDALQSDRVSRFLAGPGDRGEIDPTGGRKDPVLARARAAIGSISTRLRADGGTNGPTYTRRERRAHDFLAESDADKLVFGHTHAPYVHHDNRAANPGSWKRTAPTHNTFLTIEGGHLELYRFRAGADNEQLA